MISSWYPYLAQFSCYKICIDLLRIRNVRPCRIFCSTIKFNYLTCIQLNLISQLLDYWNNHGFPTELEIFFMWSYIVLLNILLSLFTFIQANHGGSRRKLWMNVQSNYRPQTSFAKVTFLHLSVSNFVHSGGGVGVGGGWCPGPGPWGVSQHALRQTPSSRRLLLRTVRILLECILVGNKLLDNFMDIVWYW